MKEWADTDSWRLLCKRERTNVEDRPLVADMMRRVTVARVLQKNVSGDITSCLLRQVK